MQINFYMGDDDRRLFHEYVFSRDGYLTPERWVNTKIPIADATHQIEIEGRTLKVFKEDLFPKSNFDNEDWITYHNPTRSFYVHGPGMEYLKSYTDEKGLHRGRIYMGLVSAFSFVKPGEKDLEAYATYNEKYKQVENFYKSCCRYIRKNFRKDDVDFYHGSQSDLLAQKDIPKLQF
ncbi:MAG: hypothetical protein RIF33_02730 [Cyclobacteriaceae bacterium]